MHVDSNIERNKNYFDIEDDCVYKTHSKEPAVRHRIAVEKEKENYVNYLTVVWLGCLVIGAFVEYHLIYTMHVRVRILQDCPHS